MRLGIILAGISVIAAVTLAADESSPVTVTLKRLIEKRELSVEKSPFSGWDNGIDMYLHVDGAGVKGARKYGKLKIAEAKDDAGTDLTKKAKDGPNFESEQYQDVREPQSFGFSDEKKPKPTGFDVEVRLPTPPVRAAKAISVKGAMEILVGGEKKLVEVKKLKAAAGKPIDDPSLKAVGVTVTVQDPSKPGLAGVLLGGGDGMSVPLLLTGNLDAIAELKFIDAKGESLSQGSMSMSGQPANKRTVTYQLSKKWDDDVTLQIEVWPGQKTVKVPFELKDVKLP